MPVGVTEFAVPVVAVSDSASKVEVTWLERGGPLLEAVVEIRFLGKMERKPDRWRTQEILLNHPRSNGFVPPPSALFVSSTLVDE